ncbi:MAG: prepilin peptidase [Patescibacteria group bacterium]|nr:prepilin peptidase [Patescibacteria group bacterium]
MVFLFALFSFLFGLAIGSFLNCLIYRLSQKKSLFGYSFCPACQHRLSFFDLIPLFSFLFLKGRCRYCQAKISWQYPLIELTTGALFLLASLKLSHQFLSIYPQFPISNFQFSIFLLRDWLFLTVMVFIFVYDLKYMLIEDTVVIPATIVIFLLNLLLINSTTYHLTTLLLGGFFGFGFFLLQYLLTAKKGIGEGDLRLGLLLGLTFAWPKILVVLVISYLLGGFASLILLITHQKKLTSKIPLGPFLAVGGVMTLFFGDLIFLSFFGKI